MTASASEGGRGAVRLLVALLRSYGAAAAMLGLLLGSYLVDFSFFCREHRQAVRAGERGGDPGVLDSGHFILARPDEQIAVCFSQHCPEVPTLTGHRYLDWMCHQDLGCYCVPSEGNPSGESIARSLFSELPGPSTCRIDKPHPRSDDETGACPHARCLAHLVP